MEWKGSVDVNIIILFFTKDRKHEGRRDLVLKYGIHAQDDQ